MKITFSTIKARYSSALYQTQCSQTSNIRILGFFINSMHFRKQFATTLIIIICNLSTNSPIQTKSWLNTDIQEPQACPPSSVTTS